MSLHPKLPASPCAPLLPEHRWFPADEALRSTDYEKLLPPLVAKVRREIHDWRKSDYRAHLAATKSIFNKVVGEPNSGGFELRFAAFLEEAPDVQAFAKNYLAIGFKLDYVKANGDLSNYTPDFIVRTADAPSPAGAGEGRGEGSRGIIRLVETKGREEIDLPQKMARLKQWCADATASEENGQRYAFVFVDQNGFEKHAPKNFAALAASFTDYQA